MCLSPLCVSAVIACHCCRIRWVTTKGSFLTTAVFTNEDEMSSEQMSNDDKILTTAATLCRNNLEQIQGKWGGRFVVRWMFAAVAKDVGSIVFIRFDTISTSE